MIILRPCIDSFVFLDGETPKGGGVAGINWFYVYETEGESKPQRWTHPRSQIIYGHRQTPRSFTSNPKDLDHSEFAA